MCIVVVFPARNEKIFKKFFRGIKHVRTAAEARSSCSAKKGTKRKRK